MEHFLSNKKTGTCHLGEDHEVYTKKLLQQRPIHVIISKRLWSMDFWPFSDHFGSSFQGSMSSAVLICASFSRLPLLEASIASPHRACETKDLKVWKDQEGRKQKVTKKYPKKYDWRRKTAIANQSWTINPLEHYTSNPCDSMSLFPPSLA